MLKEAARRSRVGHVIGESKRTRAGVNLEQNPRVHRRRSRQVAKAETDDAEEDQAEKPRDKTNSRVRNARKRPELLV